MSIKSIATATKGTNTVLVCPCGTTFEVCVNTCKFQQKKLSYIEKHSWIPQNNNFKVKVLKGTLCCWEI